MTTQLDTFQAALLTELREVVDGAAAPSRGARRRQHGRGAAFGAVAACVVGAAVAAPALVAGPAAFAVSAGGDGSVDVHVSRLNDTAGLERALAEVGVRSQVTYLPAGEACASDLSAPGTSPSGTAVTSVTFGDGGYSVHLDPGAVGEDQTLVIWASDLGHGDVHGLVGAVSTVSGKAPPCRVVSSTATPGAEPPAS